MRLTLLLIEVIMSTLKRFISPPPYYIFLFPPMSIKENWEPLYSQYCNDTGEFLLANHSKALTWNKIISGTRKTYSSYKWDYWTHCLYQTTLAEIHKTSTRKNNSSLQDYWPHCLYQTTLAKMHKLSTRKNKSIYKKNLSKIYSSTP